MAETATRIRIGLLFGGRSAEHDVSVLSATNVARALDPDRYDVVPIFVTRDGLWLRSRVTDQGLDQPADGPQLCLVPGGQGRLVALSPAAGGTHELPRLDALFPVLHGLHGEDGTPQGAAAVAGVPLVGCGVLGSAVALDKAIAKRLLAEAGLPVARSVTLVAGAIPDFAEVEARLGLPLFIKPARQGSSVGVGKVGTEADYRATLAEAFRHDSKVLAEAFVRGREIECAVLQDAEGGLFASRCGEIVPAARHGFYTYDAKYVDAEGAALNVPADLPPGLEDRIRGLAVEAFRALGCDGMARVDVFLTEAAEVLVNEVNTIPGFTDVSMYPKLMAASGIAYPDLIDRLVRHGLARAGR